MEIILVIVLLIAGISIYFLPTIVAVCRKKKNAGAIFVLNLFLGLTFIAWVVALVWASTYEEGGRNKRKSR
jgi:hypothetical protein